MNYRLPVLNFNLSFTVTLTLNLLTVPALFNLPLAAEAQRDQRVDHNTYYRAPHSMAGKMIVLPIGTTFEGRLSKSLSSTRSHAGESFSIILSAPVLSNGIDVIIPAGSQVMGEVVEAIPSSKQERIKRMPPPKGKLRIQITQLRTPDGTSFPLVGNLIGDQANSRGQLQTQMGSSVGFVGTSESFEAVAPGSNRYGKQYGGQGRSPQGEYVHKREFLADEIYGMGDERGNGIDDHRIRSLYLRKFDLYMDGGSPVTVKLMAPMRIAVSPARSGAPVGSVEDVGAVDDALPVPSPKSPSADIPPITDGGGQAAAPPERRRTRPAAQEPAAPAAAPPAPVTPPATTPGASPSSEF